MKISVFTLLLLAHFSSLGNRDAVFIKEDWAKAQELAKQMGKPLVVDFYTDWCGWCKVMDKETFADENVIVKLNEEYVALKINAEKGIGIDVAKKYRVSAFPTIGFFSSDGHLMGKALGYQKKDQFIQLLDSMRAYNVEGLNRFPGITRNLKIDLPDFMNMPWTTKEEGKLLKANAKEWFANQSSFASEASFTSFAKYSRFSTGREVDIFLAEKEDLIRLFGKSEVEGVIDNIVSTKYYQVKKTKSKDEFKVFLTSLREYYDDDERMDAQRAYFRLGFALATEQYIEFVGLIKESIKKEDINEEGLNEYAWTLYEECDDIEALKAALDWMSFVDKPDADYNHVDTYAALAYKLRNYNLAKKYAIKAIKMGKEQDGNVSATKKLLKKIEEAMD